MKPRGFIHLAMLTPTGPSCRRPFKGIRRPNTRSPRLRSLSYVGRSLPGNKGTACSSFAGVSIQPSRWCSSWFRSHTRDQQESAACFQAGFSRCSPDYRTEGIAPRCSLIWRFRQALRFHLGLGTEWSARDTHRSKFHNTAIRPRPLKMRAGRRVQQSALVGRRCLLRIDAYPLAFLRHDK